MQVVHTPVAVVRSGPGPQHPIVATLREGEVLTIDARSGPWYHLQLADTQSGWVHEDLLQTYVDPRKFQFVPDPGLPSRMRSFHFVAFAGNYAADREDNGILLGSASVFADALRVRGRAGLHARRAQHLCARAHLRPASERGLQDVLLRGSRRLDGHPARPPRTPFLSAAAGASVLEGHAEPTYTIGLGTKFFVSKRTALRWELRDHRMHGGNQFTRFSGDNAEFSGGCSCCFEAGGASFDRSVLRRGECSAAECRTAWSAALAWLGFAVCAVTAAGAETARDGLALAAAAADAWADDARLVWVENDSSIDAFGQAASWGYLYYSPEKHAMRSWSVDGAEIVEAVDQAVVAEAPAIDSGWKDSAEIAAVACRRRPGLGVPLRSSTAWCWCAVSSRPARPGCGVRNGGGRALPAVRLAQRDLQRKWRDDAGAANDRRGGPRAAHHRAGDGR